MRSPIAILFALSLAACAEDPGEHHAAAPFAAPVQTVVVAYPAAAMVGGSPSPASSPAPSIQQAQLVRGPIIDGNYVLRNVSSRQCLDVPRQTHDSQALLWQWDCNDTAAQTWTLTRVRENDYVLRSAASGKCLDVPNGLAGTNVNVWQVDCNGTDAQTWTLEETTGETFVLRSRASKECLDVPHGRTQRGLGVQQYTCHGGAPQRWVLTKVP